MKLGVLLAGRRPEDIAKRFEQASEAGFFLCQLNLYQTGLTRAELLSIADASLEFGVRPAAVGCYVNPMRPDDAGFNGASRSDLDFVLQSLDLIGARRIVLWSGTHAEGLYDEHDDNRSEDSLNALRVFLTDVVRTTRARHYFLTLEPWRTHVLNHEERIVMFHASLAPDVGERVRYVLDACDLLDETRYPARNSVAQRICARVGPLTGVVHLRDIIMPPDGEESLPAPGQGTLDYPEYVKAGLAHTRPDAPVIARNIPVQEYAEVRDYLLRMDDKWELA